MNTITIVNLLNISIHNSNGFLKFYELSQFTLNFVTLEEIFALKPVRISYKFTIQMVRQSTIPIVNSK